MTDIQSSLFKKQLYILLLAVIAAGTALGIRFFTAPRFKTAYSGTREVMGTFCRIVSVAPDTTTAEAGIEAAFSELVRLDNMMSDYKPDSELSEVNARAFKEPVSVGSELMEVLSIAKKYSELSDGAFDVTIGAVADLWRNAQKQGVVPTEKQLAEAKTKVGYEKLILNDHGNTVRFAVEGMRLDLGAIAKGYAVDTAVEAMKRAGAAAGFVDVGGDIRTFGAPPKPRKHWFVGLQDPAKEDGSVMVVLKMNDMAVATSGDYRRYEEIEGQKYSHIKNPETSQAVQKLISVSVIAPTAVEADILATIVSVTGPEKGLGMIESMENIELIMIPADAKHELIHTKNIRKYIADDAWPPAGYTLVSEMLKKD